jgi:hypothetical protein
MDDLDPIEQKALETARSSADPDAILKAIQILNAVADRRQKLSDCEEAARTNQKAGPIFERTQILAKILTPVLPVIAIVLTAGTLLFQIVQFNKTSESQRSSTEDTEWHETMKTVSLQPPSAALVGAFNMQSFLSSDRYGGQARSILATLLPDIEDSSGFDVVFFNLHRTIDSQKQVELIGIARVVAAKAYDNFNSGNPGSTKTFQEFVQDTSGFYAGEPNAPNLGLALARSWELDSISHGLSVLWVPNTPRYKGSPSGLNLSGIILENNFSGVDFSSTNLSSTNFWGATVTNADFGGVSKFDKSNWSDTDWWNASKMSCDLAHYLQRGYPPRKSEDRVTAGNLVARSCPGS